MARAATTTDIFNALGETSRRQILDVLAAGEATVGAIVAALDLSQPQVSKHLKVLRDVELVQARHDGRHRVYRVHAPALRPLQTWLAHLTDAVNEHYDRLDEYLAATQASAASAHTTNEEN